MLFPNPLLSLVPLLFSPFPLLTHAQSLLSGPGVRPPSYTQLTHTGPGCPSDAPEGTVTRFSGSSGRAGDLNFRLAAFAVDGPAKTWCDIALQFGGNQETRMGRRVAVHGVRTRFHLHAAGQGRVVVMSAFDSWWEDGEETEVRSFSLPPSLVSGLLCFYELLVRSLTRDRRRTVPG